MVELREGERSPVRDVVVVIDVTGIGRGVYDTMADELKGQPVSVTPVTFNHGEKISTTKTGRHRELVCGKAALVSRLQALL